MELYLIPQLHFGLLFISCPTFLDVSPGGPLKGLKACTTILLENKKLLGSRIFFFIGREGQNI